MKATEDELCRHNTINRKMLSKTLLNQARGFSSTASKSAFAKLNLMGTIGSITPKETKDGTPFLTYSLAVNRYSPNSEDGKVTDWFNVSVFNERQVAFFNDYLKPGAQIYSECDVRQRKYTDEAGETKYTTALRQISYDVVKFPKRTEEEFVEEE